LTDASANETHVGGGSCLMIGQHKPTDPIKHKRTETRRSSRSSESLICGELLLRQAFSRDNRSQDSAGSPLSSFFSGRSRSCAEVEKHERGDAAVAARLETVCSVGPPTVSDTDIPTDEGNVGGDYVRILAPCQQKLVAPTGTKRRPAGLRPRQSVRCFRPFQDDCCFIRGKRLQDRRFLHRQQEI
jgi:hypothetical protein